MNRFSVMITGGATVISCIVITGVAAIFTQDKATLTLVAKIGAGIGLVGSLIVQAVKPLK